MRLMPAPFQDSFLSRDPEPDPDEIGDGDEAGGGRLRDGLAKAGCASEKE